MPEFKSGTGEFPAQLASNAENVSIWWRHHAWDSPRNNDLTLKDNPLPNHNKTHQSKDRAHNSCDVLYLILQNV